MKLIKYFSLKRLRILYSSIFFILYILLFSGAFIAGGFLIRFLESTQLIPSILYLKNGLFSGVFGLLVIILLTFFFGRIYCSGICPLGTLQDIFLSFRKKRNFRYRKPFFWIHYGILIAVIISAIAGFSFFIGIVDPFSFFGRIFVAIFKPIFSIVYNFLTLVLGRLKWLFLKPIPLYNIPFFSLIFSVFLFTLLFFASAFYGRIYCNAICPIGAILGILSRISLFKVRFDEKCIECGLCVNNCPASCIDVNNRYVDNTRCIKCFNCINLCPQKSLSYGIINSSKKANSHLSDSVIPDKGRRNALMFTGRIVSTGFLLLLANRSKIFSSPVLTAKKKKYPVSPPGSLSFKHLHENCTSCLLCVSNCPTGVIKSSVKEYGIMGLFMPTMDYDKSFCNYDCVRCTEVCPTGALKRLSVEEKHKVQLGRVRLLKNLCIVYQQNKHCGACAEACPTKATFMVPFKGNLYAPETDEKYCVGCGACEHVCPAKPEKAIYVEGLTMHQIAVIKKEIKSERKEEQGLKEFPF